MIQRKRPAYAGRFVLRPQAWGAAANGQRGKCVQHVAPDAARRPTDDQTGWGCQARAAVLAATAPQRGRIGTRRAQSRLTRGLGVEPRPPVPEAGARGERVEDRGVQPRVVGGMYCHRKGIYPLAPASKRTRGRGIQPWRAPRHAATGASSRGGKGAIGVTIRSTT
jgi:hypothetical protein